MFDHEKLEVYQLELRFVTWVTDLLEEVRVSGAKTAETREQLDRASQSMVYNTSEGNAKRQPGLRTRYFDDARGSVMESASALDVLVAKRACEKDRIAAGKQMLERIAQMLVKLSPIDVKDGTVREERAEYEAPPSDEADEL